MVFGNERFPSSEGNSRRYTAEDAAVFGSLEIEPTTWAVLEEKFPGTREAVESVREGKADISTLPELMREDVKRLMLSHASRE